MFYLLCELHSNPPPVYMQPDLCPGPILAVVLCSCCVPGHACLHSCPAILQQQFIPFLVIHRNLSEERRDILNPPPWSCEEEVRESSSRICRER